MERFLTAQRVFTRAYGNLYAKFDAMKWFGYSTAANVGELIFVDSKRHSLAQEQAALQFDKKVSVQAISPLEPNQLFKLCH